MICDDVCTLLKEIPEAHGVFQPPQMQPTRVFCTVESVGRNEYWKALSNGLEASYVLKLSEAADYHGEKILLFRGKRYRVLRTYVTDSAIELTIGEVTADAEKPG